MPRGDRTGPQGQGPMTGRGHGKCIPKDRASVPQGQDGMGAGRNTDRGQGRGLGQGAGRGARRRAGQGRGRRS